MWLFSYLCSRNVNRAELKSFLPGVGAWSARLYFVPLFLPSASFPRKPGWVQNERTEKREITAFAHTAPHFKSPLTNCSVIRWPHVPWGMSGHMCLMKGFIPIFVNSVFIFVVCVAGRGLYTSKKYQCYIMIHSSFIWEIHTKEIISLLVLFLNIFIYSYEWIYSS